MQARLATAVAGIPVLVYAALVESFWPVRVLVVLVGWLALFEIRRAERITSAFHWAFVLVLPFAAYYWDSARSPDWALFALILLVVATFVGRRIAPGRYGKQLTLAFVELGWVVVPLITLIDLRFYDLSADAGLLSFQTGSALLLLFVCLWAGDSAAFFIGKAFGRHKLAPDISPGKTWEGAAANLAATIAVGTGLGQAFGMTQAEGLGVGIIVGLLGQAGDLFESAWKRTHGLKDSGGFLPGHGGVLDRFDSMLFCVPGVTALLYSGALA